MTEQEEVLDSFSTTDCLFIIYTFLMVSPFLLIDWIIGRLKWQPEKR